MNKFWYLLSFLLVSAGTIGQSITLSDSILNVGQTLKFSYSGGTGSATDWVGIYTVDEIPDGDPASLQWHYIKTSAAQDSIQLNYIDGGKPIVGGKYRIHLFCCDGYKSLASRTFSIVGATPASIGSNTYAKEGSDITFNYSGGTGDTTDWIGIYKPTDKPGTDQSLAFEYVKTSSGTKTFKNPGLAAGEYIARLFCCDGYNVLASYKLTIFANIPPSLAPVGALQAGKPITFKFTGGTGDFSDWVGVYAKDSVPDGDPASVTYLYVNGVNGELTFPANDLKAGVAYDAHLFCCDGYTILASYKNFSLTSTVNTGDAKVKNDRLFTTHPSPARERVQIKFEKNSTGQFIFYNLSGQVMRQIPVVNTDRLDVYNLPSGSYIGRYTGKEGSLSKMIIVLDY